MDESGNEEKQKEETVEEFKIELIKIGKLVENTAQDKKYVCEITC